MTPDEAFDDLITPLGIPTISRLPIGHGEHLATLPIGAHVQLDAANARLDARDAGTRRAVHEDHPRNRRREAVRFDA